MGMLDDVYSVDEAAKLLGLRPTEVYALLRKDQHTPPMERSFPGAWKQGGSYDAEWFIPESAVEHWRAQRYPQNDEALEGDAP